MIGRNGGKLISNLCEQSRDISLNFGIGGIYVVRHKCTMECSLYSLQWIRQYMLMKPIGLSKKPFHVISFMGVTQAFFDNKSHKAAERRKISKMVPQSYMLVTQYLHISFKETLKVLPAPQDL